MPTDVPNVDAVVIDEAATTPGGTPSSAGTYWVKEGKPSEPWFTDDGGASFRLANADGTLPDTGANGLVARTGTGPTVAARQILPETNGGINVANGSGVSGNPSVRLAIETLTNVAPVAADEFAFYDTSGSVHRAATGQTVLEITNNLTNKATPTTSDRVLIMDAAAGNAAKYATIGTLPGGGEKALKSSAAPFPSGVSMNSSETSRWTSGAITDAAVGDLIEVQVDGRFGSSASTGAVVRLRYGSGTGGTQLATFSFDASQRDYLLTYVLRVESVTASGVIRAVGCLNANSQTGLGVSYGGGTSTQDTTSIRFSITDQRTGVSNPRTHYIYNVMVKRFQL